LQEIWLHIQKNINGQRHVRQSLYEKARMKCKLIPTTTPHLRI